MEILFENRFVPTVEIIREVYRKTRLCSPRALVLYAVCAYFLIRTIWALCFGGNLLPILPLLAVFALGKHFWDYHRAVKEAMEHPTEQRIVVTEQGIAMDGYPSVITCSQIRKVSRTKNLILLHTRGKQVISLPCRSFTIGAMEDFLLFMILNGFKIHQPISWRFCGMK